MFTTSPLSDGLGARLHGAVLATPLAGDAFAAIERAFYAAQVLVLPAQHLTPSQFVTWARCFGVPEPHVIDQFHHPADSNILILTNRRNDRASRLGSPMPVLTFTPTIRTWPCRRARQRCTHSKCQGTAGARCSRISTLPTMACLGGCRSASTDCSPSTITETAMISMRRAARWRRYLRQSRNRRCR